MPAILTPEFMGRVVDMMLARAMQSYEKDGVLREAVLLLGGKRGAAVAVNTTASPWYRSPEAVVSAIRSKGSVAAVFVTPAYVAIHGTDGQEQSVGEMVLVYATYPAGGYRQQAMADVITEAGKVTCRPRNVVKVHVPETHVGWLDQALSA